MGTSRALEKKDLCTKLVYIVRLVNFWLAMVRIYPYSDGPVISKIYDLIQTFQPNVEMFMEYSKINKRCFDTLSVFQ